MRYATYALSVLLVWCTPLGAQDANRSARVDAIFAEYARTTSPGCAVGVAQDGKLVHRKGYGMANLDHGIPLSPASVFYIASVSKQFTATVATLLAAEGRISLDDDVRTYIPELPDYGKTITIRHLIHHTSGLRDYLELMGMAGMRVADVHSSGEVLDLIARQRELNFAPASEHLYSNTGYFLISVITERVTGKSLRDYADEKIFRPLGMGHTHFHDDRTMIVPGRVTSYSPRREGGYSVADWANFEQVGSGGLHSSVDDLLRWDQNFYQNKLAAADLLPTLHTRGVLVNGDTIAYAFGLQLGEYRGLRTVRHGGSSMGFRTHLLRFPDQRFSAVVLCNLGTADPATLAERISDIYLAERLRAPARVAAVPRAEARNESKPPAPTVDLLGGYVGRYHAPELGVDYTLTLEGNALRLRRPAAAEMTLAPLGPDSYRAGSWIVRFSRDGQGRVTGFAVDAGRVRNLRFERRSERSG
jgi:CubicO group peptidase (beta-lactamase class C family)